MPDDGLELKEYQARAVLGVMPDAPRREVAIALKGEASEEFDIAIRLPAGAVAALIVELHAALSAIDRTATDSTVIAQHLVLSGARAANRVVGLPALVLSLGGLQIPVVVQPAEAVPQILAALEQAAEIPDGDPSRRRLS
ncbi:MAG TPA: hypothetical protein VNX86_09070 [Rhizomicrobium sp.]|jgi:hypothetical protein|nr:hypothetical protein [Rhizomicrobium sp.]